MKKISIILIICVCIMMAPGFSFAGNGRRNGNGNRYGRQHQSMNNSGNTSSVREQNFVDNNGDGICDNRGTGRMGGQLKGQGKGNMQTDNTRVRPKDGNGPQRSRDGSNCGTIVDN